MDALSELEKLRAIAEETPLGEDATRAVAWCLSSLPRLYENLFDSCESRFANEIQRIVQGTLRNLAETGSTDGQRLGRALIVILHRMHERLGIQKLNVRQVSTNRPTRQARVK